MWPLISKNLVDTPFYNAGHLSPIQQFYFKYEILKASKGHIQSDNYG